MHLDLSLLSIELLTVGLGLVVQVLGLIVPARATRGLAWISAIGLLGILCILIASWGTTGSTLSGMFLVDDYTTFWKITFLTGAILVLFGSMRYIDNMGLQKEYYGIFIFATLGMMIMASAGDLITLYMGLELMTISFIIMVCLYKNSTRSVEAGIKYIILAALSSAVLLYGLSLIYGLTGSIMIDEIAREVATGAVSPALILGTTLVIAGLAFKISAVPFHMWTPDVYDGAPTPITAFLAAGSKAASFAIVVRILLGALPGIWSQWVMVVAILAGITMIIGNLIAIAQDDIKRLLAYSSVAQAGYIMVGLIAASEAGVKAVMFYAFLYVFATVGAFTVVSYFHNITGSNKIKDYAGLSQRSPLMAAVMLVTMLSIAGIPPLAGFVGKFYLFKTIIDTHLWLALIGLIMSMISVYYYLKVALVMYRDEPIDPTPIKLSSPVALTLIITMAATLFIGIYPGPLSEVVNSAAHAFFIQ